MKKNTIITMLGIVLAVSVSLWGCPKKAEVSSGPEAQNGAGSAADAQKQGATAGAADAAKSDSNAASAERASAASGGLQPIYFEYNQALIRADVRQTLTADAEWLKAHPAVKIEIDGNCDERGTAEYNQALGQRRAANAKKILTDLGIASKRIALVSFGKEKPVCREETEACWQKNRRDDFVAVQ